MENPLPTVLFALPLPPPYSGQEMVTQMLLSSRLHDRFHIIHLDTSNKTSNVERGRLDWQNSFMTMRNIIKLLMLLKQHHPQIVKTTIPKNRMGFIKFAAFVLLSSWSGARVVSRSGGEHFGKFYERESKWMQKFVCFTLRHIDAVIVEADRLKHPFHSFFPPEKIWTAYLGLDVKMFDSALASIQRKKAGLEVLFVGHISKAKGALDLLEAATRVVQKHPDVHFQLAGNVLKQERNITFIDNPDDIEAEVMRLINQPALKEAVTLLGVIAGEEKLRTIAEADIFVLPSYAEGFPFAVLEAMLAGKAVITTPVGALPEVFEHEKHLLFVEPGDVEAIAEAIERLIHEPQFREHLGRTARKTVQDRFNLDRLADRMEEVFRSVLGE